MCKVYISSFFSICAILITVNISAAQGLSYRSLAKCDKDYSELLQSEEGILDLEELPPGTYLARSVTQSLEKSDEKYYSHQTLLTESQSLPEICYQGLPTSAVKIRSFIPTLIDRTETHKWGNTFWSLSTALEKQTGAVHAKRSLIPNDNYRKSLTQQGFKVTSHQKDHREYILKLERNIASWKETIVISYDQF